MARKKCCIVVPLYKNFEELDIDELCSLNQLYLVLNKYKIYLTGPSELNWNEYYDHAKQFKASVTIQNFEPEYFSSISGYNKLLLDKTFYKAFNHFKFILIYQTDAFVFKDNLEEWCERDYDYIGAPWFSWDTNSSSPTEIIGVGNGGFSLRNTSSAILAIDRLLLFRKLYKFYKSSFLKKVLPESRFLQLLSLLFSTVISKEVAQNLASEFGSIHEDIFWAFNISKLLPAFKISPKEDAMKFSFEINAPLLYEKNNHTLPFGCHAWKRYSYDFWKAHINAEVKKYSLNDAVKYV